MWQGKWVPRVPLYVTFVSHSNSHSLNHLLGIIPQLKSAFWMFCATFMNLLVLGPQNNLAAEEVPEEVSVPKRKRLSGQNTLWKHSEWLNALPLVPRHTNVDCMMGGHCPDYDSCLTQFKDNKLLQFELLLFDVLSSPFTLARPTPLYKSRCSVCVCFICVPPGHPPPPSLWCCSVVEAALISRDNLFLGVGSTWLNIYEWPITRQQGLREHQPNKPPLLGNPFFCLFDYFTTIGHGKSWLQCYETHSALLRGWRQQ